MIEPMSLQEIAKYLGNELKVVSENLTDDISVNNISTDSREANEGGLFVALKGDNFDGHKFIDAATDQGANAVLISQEVATRLPSIISENTLKDYGKIARLNRDKAHCKVVALTGSAGKTSSKEMIACVLREQGNTHSTYSNFNNEVGVPKTLLEIDDGHDYAVIEMGAAKVGDIAYLMEFVNPDVALLTNAMHAHIEGFGSLENVVAGKGEIFSNLAVDGTAVINMDDNAFDTWRELIADRNCYSFSVANAAADFYAKDISSLPDGSRFQMVTPAGSAQVHLQVPGLHMVSNALASAAVAHSLKISLNKIVAGLGNYSGIKGRLQLHRCHGKVIIDDTYNANPGSMSKSIEVLAMQAGNCLAVLGHMAELGSASKNDHFDVIELCQSKNLAQVFLIGDEWLPCRENLPANMRHFNNRTELLIALESATKSYDAILFKGSRSMKMEDYLLRSLEIAKGEVA